MPGSEAWLCRPHFTASSSPLDPCEGNVPEATGTEEAQRDQFPGCRAGFRGSEAGIFVFNLLVDGPVSANDVGSRARRRPSTGTLRVKHGEVHRQLYAIPGQPILFDDFDDCSCRRS